MKRSAGILLYRAAGDGTEVLLVHPGGPFWAKKDLGAWSIPKGEIDEGEEPLRLRPARARGGARLAAGARPRGADRARLGAPEGEDRPRPGRPRPTSTRPTLQSNTFAMEWPPRSGKRARVPRGRPGRVVRPRGRRGARSCRPRPSSSIACSSASNRFLTAWRTYTRRVESPAEPERLNQEGFAAFAARPARSSPVVMLNLLRFKPDGGQERYAEYGAAVAPLAGEGRRPHRLGRRAGRAAARRRRLGHGRPGRIPEPPGLPRHDRLARVPGDRPPAHRGAGARRAAPDGRRRELPERGRPLAGMAPNGRPLPLSVRLLGAGVRGALGHQGGRASTGRSRPPPRRRWSPRSRARRSNGRWSGSCRARRSRTRCTARSTARPSSAALIEALDSEMVDEVWRRLLASDEAQRLVERIAEAPEIRAAISAQSVGLIEDVGHTIGNGDPPPRRRRRARSRARILFRKRARRADRARRRGHPRRSPSASTC